MDLEVIKELFQAHLGPITSDISELKRGQAEIIEIIRVQTRHDEAINNIKIDVDECSENMKKLKETGNSRLWEVIRLGIAGFLGALGAKLF